MTDTSDITKIREWEDVDGHELYDPADPDSGYRWPGPDQCIESRISGALRQQILRNLGRAPDDTCDIRLVERTIEGGYSEFTVEHDYEIEVWVQEGRQAQRVWSNDSIFNRSTMAAFLDWAAPPDEAVQP